MTNEHLHKRRSLSMVLINKIGGLIIGAHRAWYQNAAPMAPSVIPKTNTMPDKISIESADVRCEECPKVCTNRVYHPAEKDVECPFYDFPDGAKEPKCAQSYPENIRLN